MDHHSISHVLVLYVLPSSEKIKTNALEVKLAHTAVKASQKSWLDSSDILISRGVALSVNLCRDPMPHHGTLLPSASRLQQLGVYKAVHFIYQCTRAQLNTIVNWN